MDFLQIKELEAAGVRPQDSKTDTGLGGGSKRRVRTPSVSRLCSKTKQTTRRAFLRILIFDSERDIWSVIIELTFEMIGEIDETIDN